MPTNTVSIWQEVALNLQIILGRTDIFTVIRLAIHKKFAH